MNNLAVSSSEKAYDLKSELVDSSELSSGLSAKFLRGVSKHIRAVRLNRILEAENQRLREQNKTLLYENTHDDLTGALNKKAWKASINERIASGQPFGVIFMDMDSFKKVNDVLGHNRGDQLLSSFGEHVRSSFRREGESFSHESLFARPSEEDFTLGRYGGDEFGIVVNIADRGSRDNTTVEERMTSAEDYVRSLVDNFVSNQDLDIRSQSFGISIGGAIWHPESPVSVTELISQADEAMYLDKTAKGNVAR